jgi:hypothetical protein
MHMSCRCPLGGMMRVYNRRPHSLNDSHCVYCRQLWVQLSDWGPSHVYASQAAAASGFWVIVFCMCLHHGFGCCCRFIFGLPLWQSNAVQLSREIINATQKHFGKTVIGYELGNEVRRGAFALPSHHPPVVCNTHSYRPVGLHSHR